MCRNSTRLAVSQRAGLYMYGSQHFDIVPPGIELEKFAFSPEKRIIIRATHHCENCFVVGVVGRLVGVKNYEFAL